MPDEKAQEIIAAMTGAAQGTGRLSFMIEGAGAFPNVRKPRVIWIGVTGDVEKLAVLQAAVEDAMGRLDRLLRDYTQA